MFAGRHANRCNVLADRGVAEDIIGTRRLLDPPGIEFRETVHVAYRLVDFPYLVGVHHEPALPADFFAQDARAAHVVFDIAAHFELERVPARLERLTRKTPYLAVGIAEPPG